MPSFLRIPSSLKYLPTLGLRWYTKFAVHFWVNPVLLRIYLRQSHRNDLIRLGSAYGGWWVPEFVVKPGRVAYSAGSGTDITFDVELHNKGLRVVAIDPTPIAVEHVRQNAPEGDNFVFVPIGLWDESTELQFHVPKIEGNENFSAVNLQETEDTLALKVETLKNLAAELGDSHIDLFKLDIEGSEHRVLASVLSDGLRPTVICCEFDQPVPMRTVVKSVRRLQSAGYELVNVERWDYTFVLSGADESGRDRTQERNDASA